MALGETRFTPEGISGRDIMATNSNKVSKIEDTMSIDEIIAAKDADRPCGHCGSDLHWGHDCPIREMSIDVLYRTEASSAAKAAADAEEEWEHGRFKRTSPVRPSTPSSERRPVFGV